MAISKKTGDKSWFVGKVNPRILSLEMYIVTTTMDNCGDSKTEKKIRMTTWNLCLSCICIQARTHTHMHIFTMELFTIAMIQKQSKHLMMNEWQRSHSRWTNKYYIVTKRKKKSANCNQMDKLGRYCE